MTDEELFREWQAGSAGALEALVRRHHAPLLAHLYRLTGDRSLAEDLVQETFLRLVREAHAYRYPRPFVPWLCTIARNLARNHWESAAYRRTVAWNEGASARTDAADPTEWLERLEGRDGIGRALAALTFEHREVLSLRYGQELPVEQVAAVLGLPVGTVKSRTFTALRRLRALLQPDSATEGDARADGAARRL